MRTAIPPTPSPYSVIGLVAALSIAAAPAAAADLRNENDHGYEVRVEDGAITTHTSIGPNTSRIALTKQGTAIVVGAGSFRADGLWQVRIRDDLLHFD